MKRKPEIVIYYYRTNPEEVGIEDITVDGNHVDRLLETELGTISIHNEYALEDLESLEDNKKANINLEEVEEGYSDDADIAYAMGDHGCESFDEFIDRSNFPEDYE